MAKFERILSFFPGFHGASEQHKLLYHVVRLLVQPLEEADTHLFRIQRAHRLEVAQHAQDLIRLAALLNLTPFHFEDLLASGELDYEQKLALMRDRVKRTAQIHLTGLGTPWAVMQGAATFLDATIVPEWTGDPLIKHLDADGFSHKAIVEFGHLPETPREPLILHESPFQRKKIELAERWTPTAWAVKNSSTQAAPVRLVIQGLGDRTVLPSIYCPETEEGILFYGLVPNGQMLVLDEGTGATLDDHPVDDWLVYFKGSAYDFGQTERSTVVREEGSPTAPFGGDVEAIVSRPYPRRKPAPTARVGQTRWRFQVAEGVYDGALADFAVYATDQTRIGIYDEDYAYDACVFDYPPSGVAGMAWDERVPCAFKLLLPAHVPQPQSAANGAEGGGEGSGSGAMAGPVNYVSRIGNIIPRFKAAGVLAFVDTARDGWILGESIIRGPAAPEGDGVTLHATRLRDRKAGMLVSLDQTTE